MENKSLLCWVMFWIWYVVLFPDCKVNQPSTSWKIDAKEIFGSVDV
jgi:hypothetical protein